MTAPVLEANLLNDLTNNFQEWHQTILEDGSLIAANAEIFNQFASVIREV